MPFELLIPEQEGDTIVYSIFNETKNVYVSDTAYGICYYSKRELYHTKEKAIKVLLLCQSLSSEIFIIHELKISLTKFKIEAPEISIDISKAMQKISNSFENLNGKKLINLLYNERLNNSKYIIFITKGKEKIFEKISEFFKSAPINLRIKGENKQSCYAFYFDDLTHVALFKLLNTQPNEIKIYDIKKQEFFDDNK